MDLRDWLIVVGVIIILGILIDGYRRMRLARMDSLKMSRDMGGDFANTPIDDDFNPELPSGGARIVSRDDNEESVDPDAPGISDSEDAAPIVADREDRIDSDYVASESGSKKSRKAEDIPVAHAGHSVNAPLESNNDDNPVALGEPEEVIVINVHAKGEPWFQGAAIKKLLEACGLDHGDMSIFHRHEEDDLLSPIQFSVANAVEPGYFDPEKIDTLSTPGVSFFMSLPGPKDYMKAFDYMLETAQCFAKNLNGELKDEQRSVMTTQTIEHCRQRIREFERKQLSKSRA